MVFQFIVFAVGLVVLYYGAEWLIRSASSIALHFGIRPMVIGLTVVALGTSMPEFVLNFFAVLIGVDALAVGNIVGSNIANIGLILGVSAMLMPLVVSRETLKKEYPLMVATTLLFYGLAADGLISRVDGGVLVVCLVALMIFLVIDARRHARTNARRSGPAPDAEIPTESGPFTRPDLSTRKRVILLVAGMIGLTLGARLMVSSAVEIARVLEIHPIVIGLTIVAIGTSLPELAASVMCAVRKEVDMSVGNVLGSNMLNILFVVGVVSIVQPMTVERMSITHHFPVMVAFALVLFPLVVFRHSLSKLEGALLLAGFACYIGWLIIPYL